jgi:hypothetical protein
MYESTVYMIPFFALFPAQQPRISDDRARPAEIARLVRERGRHSAIPGS